MLAIARIISFVVKQMRTCSIRCFCILLIVFIATGCSSTNVSVTGSLSPKNKKIGIGTFNIGETIKGTKGKPDSVCTCVGLAIKTGMVPYLHTAGFRVFNLPANNISKDDTLATGLPADADYILTGAGMVHTLGTSTFIDGLSVELVDAKTREVVAAASLTGTSVRPLQAGQKIGKSLLKKIEH